MSGDGRVELAECTFAVPDETESSACAPISQATQRQGGRLSSRQQRVDVIDPVIIGFGVEIVVVQPLVRRVTEVRCDELRR